MPTIYFTHNPSKSFTFAPLKPLQQEVKAAYFATRKSKNKYKTKVKEHKTTKGQTIGKIAKQYGVKPKAVKRTKKTKYLQIGEIVKVTIKEKIGKKVSFKKIENASVADEVFIVVETIHLEEEHLHIKILQADENVLAEVDKPITVQFDSSNVDTICVNVGNYLKEKDITNKKDFENWAIAKIKLQPKKEDEQKKWKEGLECTSSNTAKLYLSVDGHTDNSIPNFKPTYMLYQGTTNKDSKIKNHFLNTEDMYFTLRITSWHHPVMNPQLRGWYAIWAPKRSIHSNNIKGRAKGKHDGIDLYAPEGTTLYACVDGEIYDPYISGSYGNTLTIKGKYNGKTYYFFYAHLKDKVTYKAKDKIKAGDIIGSSGKTGSSAKNLKTNQVHLHFEIRTKGTRTGNRINPIETVAELKKDVITNPNKEDQK